MNGGVRFEKDAVCDQCGRFGAYIFDGPKLCGQCYEQHGSCCPEFEGKSGKPDERGVPAGEVLSPSLPTKQD